MNRETAVKCALELAKSAVSGWDKYLGEDYAEGVVEFIKTIAAGLETLDDNPAVESGQNEPREPQKSVMDVVDDWAANVRGF